jgi:hypothetical protein
MSSRCSATSMRSPSLRTGCAPSRSTTRRHSRSAFEDFADETQYWYANVRPIYVRYISNDDDYGWNIGAWRQPFAEAFACYLAFQCGFRMSSDKSNRNDLFNLSKACSPRPRRSMPLMTGGYSALLVGWSCRGFVAARSPGRGAVSDASINVYLQFSVGQQDKKHLPRVDLERMRLAAEQQRTFCPSPAARPSCGPAGIHLDHGQQRHLPAEGVRLRRHRRGVAGIHRSAYARQGGRCTGHQANGYGGGHQWRFLRWCGNWTLTATSGATSTVSGGYLNLTALARGSKASATQTVTVNQIGTEHALRVVIERGPVTLRVGSTSGGDEYINETVLRTGTHSLAFTPSGASFYIQFFSKNANLKRVDSCQVEAAGVMTLPTQWLEADLFKMRFAQSADVVFVACDGYRQQRIERRSTRSWSVVAISRKLARSQSV